MNYTNIGKIKEDFSALGFGCMRLPLEGGGSSFMEVMNKEIDEQKASEMIFYAIENGINYFDTAYFYHNGRSEKLLGKIIDKETRKKIAIATKMPTWLINTKDDFQKYLDEQLERLKTDYIDFYLIHGLSKLSWEKVNNMGVLDFLDKLKTEKIVKHIGFSFHDDFKTFKKIIDAYNWDMTQIQYNYFDVNYQAGKEGLDYAANKDIGVVIMEPLRGGMLTDKIPEKVENLWNSAEVKRTPAEWALRWVWNQSEVSVVLSGMSTLEQVKENVELANNVKPDNLNKNELELIEKVNSTYRELLEVDCTSCEYCMPCPFGVNIPFNFSLYNDTFMFPEQNISNVRYNYMLASQMRASACTDCKKCVEKCPQKIDIPARLKEVHEKLKMN